MTLVLLCLMAYQVTGEADHEFIGVGMTLLCIVHQILNRRWYGALLKGKYRAFRILQTVINILLILSFAVTAFCGMSMSKKSPSVRIPLVLCPYGTASWSSCSCHDGQAEADR